MNELPEICPFCSRNMEKGAPYDRGGGAICVGCFGIWKKYGVLEAAEEKWFFFTKDRTIWGEEMILDEFYRRFKLAAFE